jgi:hypothetical protein
MEELTVGEVLLVPLLLLSAPLPAEEDKETFGTTKGSRRGCSPLLRRLRCCCCKGLDVVVRPTSPLAPAATATPSLGPIPAGHHPGMDDTCEVMNV